MSSLNRETALQYMMKAKKQAGRFSKVLKQSSICAIKRDLTSQGVRHVDMPNLDRMKIVSGKLDDYRSKYLSEAVSGEEFSITANGVAFFTVPVWYRRPIKSSSEYRRLAAVLAFDTRLMSFFVPMPHILELFDQRRLFCETVAEEDAGILNWIPTTERTSQDEPTRDPVPSTIQ